MHIYIKVCLYLSIFISSLVTIVQVCLDSGLVRGLRVISQVTNISQILI